MAGWEVESCCSRCVLTDEVSAGGGQCRLRLPPPAPLGRAKAWCPHLVLLSPPIPPQQHLQDLHLTNPHADTFYHSQSPRLTPERCPAAPIPFITPAAPGCRAEPQGEAAEQLWGACKGLGGEEAPMQPQQRARRLLCFGRQSHTCSTSCEMKIPLNANSGLRNTTWDIPTSLPPRDVVA